MTQEEFERRHGAQWDALESLLAPRKKGETAASPAGYNAADMPHLYRRVCQHLALARDRCYGGHLIERLNQLALRGHQSLYEARGGTWAAVADFARAGFPARVRRDARFVWLAALLFYGPFVVFIAVAQVWPEQVYTVLEPAQVAEMEEMYRPGARSIGRARDADTDVMMFGFYIRNNIGIAFQCFAGGILFGLGTLFYILYNGLLLGAVAGHLTQIGYTQTFWPFVIGHGAFELTAIVLSGAAGLKLGWALLAPGRLRRGESLRRAAREAIKLVYGIAVFLLIAAFLEAFWSSSSTLAPVVKYTVGAVLWLLVLAYLVFAGRGRAAR